MIGLSGSSVQWISISYQSAHDAHIWPPKDANGSLGTHWPLTQLDPGPAPPFTLVQSPLLEQSRPPTGSAGSESRHVSTSRSQSVEVVQSHVPPLFCFPPAG